MVSFPTSGHTVLETVTPAKSTPAPQIKKNKDKDAPWQCASVYILCIHDAFKDLLHIHIKLVCLHLDEKTAIFFSVLYVWLHG